MHDERMLSSGPASEPGELNAAARRIAEMIERTWPDLGAMRLEKAGDVSDFVCDQRESVEVHVGWLDDGAIFLGVQVEPREGHLRVDAFLALLQALEGRWQWYSDDASPAIELVRRIGTWALGVLDEASIKNDLEELRKWCDAISPPPGKFIDDAALKKQYEPYEGVLAPVAPCTSQGFDLPGNCEEWADMLHGYLAAGLSVGLAGDTEIERRLAQGLLAKRCHAEGSTLGRLVLTGIEPGKLVRLAKQAPGFVSVPARALVMSTSPYERGDAVMNLLSTLSGEHAPCLFEGTHAELQALFHGGQGASNDPLCPVVCHVPEVDLNTLAGFALQDESQRAKRPLAAQMTQVVEQVREALGDQQPAAARRMLLPVVRKVISAGGKAKQEEAAAFAGNLARRTETFGGVSIQPRTRRSEEVQRHLQDRLLSGKFLEFLRERLVGQDEALAEYHVLLQEEVLARPEHQPILAALQGTPGTGKSESLALTAKWLGVPFSVIDAASMSDPHTATAQLLGSGRGIVGSHQSGRLEKLAKHHLGAVIEVADLDHAVPSVRCALGDLFLQIMQNGEAQSSIGNTFSCANLIIAFSLNLPDGKDEKMHQRVGFGSAPTAHDIRKDVRREIKSMVSGAFLSRLGEPVLFAPLSNAARIEIVNRALRSAAEVSLRRLGIAAPPVKVDEDVAPAITKRMDSSVITFGARGLVDMARKWVVKALLSVDSSVLSAHGGALRIVGNGDGQIGFVVDGRDHQVN